MDQQKQYQALTDEYQGLQTELTTVVTARQKLENQHTENKSVHKEFAGLADDAVIYKLVGPVLLKQDTSEAKSTVDGRLDYIEKEMTLIRQQQES
ncbi:Prefoldin subunit 6 [Friedmanniomyces endolithicus]|nr:Prefoldin subunit 6 [Friedmanniomyces endolithicus]